jgi:hypothetical protein
MPWSQAGAARMWYWYARASAAAGRALLHRTAAVPLSWPGGADQRAAITVHWPTTYDWAPGAKWVEPIVRGLRELVTVKREVIAQPFAGIVVARLEFAGQSYEFAIDYADRHLIDEQAVRRYSIYFKMQYLCGGYSLSHVVPGWFIPADPHLYDYLPRVRAIRDRGDFEFDVHGRFSIDFAEAARRKAVTLLSEQTRFQYHGGLTKTRYSRFLQEIARSKICIDLPGNGDFCFRLVDYLAVGACIIGPRHRTTFPVPLVDREHMVFTADDLSDLVELCATYLDSPEAREELCANTRDYFDRWLDRRQLAAYYLYSCLQLLD